MPTFAEVMANASLPEDSVRLCLAGALHAEWRDLERALAGAPTVAASLGERSPAAEIAERMQQLRERMHAAEVDFRLRAIPPRIWAAFYAARPVRADDEDEDAWRGRWFGWLCDLVSRCAVDPQMTADQVAELCDVLSGQQWDELTEATWALNGQKVSVPFSAAASALTSPSVAK